MARTFHGSHLERHWPRYGAGAAAVLAVGYAALTWKGDLLTFAIVGALAYLVAYRSMNGFRKSVDKTHQVRTQLFRSTPFLLGASLGLGFYLFATFVEPVRILGFPIGGDNPLADGLQQTDFAGAAMLAMGIATFMVSGGLAFEFVANLFRRRPDSP